MLLDISQRALIGQLDRERFGPLMAALDACNARCGRGSVVPALAGLMEKRSWSTKFETRTPRYTTQVGELPLAVADRWSACAISADAGSSWSVRRANGAAPTT